MQNETVAPRHSAFDSHAALAAEIARLREQRKKLHVALEAMCYADFKTRQDIYRIAFNETND